MVNMEVNVKDCFPYFLIKKNSCLKKQNNNVLKGV